MAERSSAELKREAKALLHADDFAARLSAWRKLPARSVIKPLLSFLCSTDELVKWRSVTAIGLVVSQLAETDMESARTILRRMIWTLTDESGGIGWGAPEAMGEIMAAQAGLATEYATILVSYIREDGASLENPLLQRGVLWGIARLAQVRPHLLPDAGGYVTPFLRSGDPTLRGLALWALQHLGASPPPALLRELLHDEATFLLYGDGELRPLRVCDLAARHARPH